MPVNKISNFKKKRFSSLERRNFGKIVDRKTDLTNLTITFRYHNGARQVMKTNREFFFDDKGRRLSATSIVQNINAIAHDMQVKDYVINAK